MDCGLCAPVRDSKEALPTTQGWWVGGGLTLLLPLLTTRSLAPLANGFDFSSCGYSTSVCVCVAGTQSRVSSMIGKYSTTEVYKSLVRQLYLSIKRKAYSSLPKLLCLSLSALSSSIPLARFLLKSPLEPTACLPPQGASRIPGRKLGSFESLAKPQLQSSKQTGNNRLEEITRQQQGSSSLTVKLIRINKCAPTHQPPAHRTRARKENVSAREESPDSHPG